MMARRRAAVGNNSPGAISSASEHGTKPSVTTYSMQVLFEEVATLRKRVRELEDDDSATRSTVGRTDSTDSGDATDRQQAEAPEVANLRKQLMRVENERANLELDFMNQLAALAREKQESIEQYESKIAKLQEDKKNGPVGDGTVSSSSATTGVSDDRDTVIQQLRDDLESADRELKVNRRDIKDMEEQIDSLEYEKTTLIDEITDIRLDYENETKMVASLRSEMDQMERHFEEKIEKLESDLRSKDEKIRQQTEAFGEMNDDISALEGQKAMLVDEITSLRMMMDREDKVKKSLKARIDKLTEGDRSITTDDAATLQRTIDDLQIELTSVTRIYKADMSRLEETVAKRDAQVNESKKLVREKELALKEAQCRVDKLESETNNLKVRLETQTKLVAEKEHEMASMTSQKASYEKHTMKNITDSVSEVDRLKAQNKALADEIALTKKKVEREKAASDKLRLEIANLKSSGVRNAPPVPLSPAPFRQRPSTPPATPTRSFTNQPVGQASPVNSTRAVSPHSKVGGLVRQFERNCSGSSSQEEQRSPSPELRVDTHQTTEFHSIPTSLPQHLAAAPVRTAPSPDSESALRHEVDDLKQQLEMKNEEVRVLREKLDKSSQIVGELRASVATLTATRAAMETQTRKEFEQKSQDDSEEMEALKKELAETKAKLESESKLVEDLKKEIVHLTSERVTYEEKAMESYEKRSAGLRKSNDAEVNKLKVELTKAQVSMADLERDCSNRIKELEEEIDEINEEVEKELEEKQRELDDIKHQLEEQREAVNRFQKEREQLCHSMNNMSNSRKDEIDDLQTELIEKTAKAAEYERELQSLKMQLELQKNNQSEVESLKEKVRELESNKNSSTMAHISRMQADKLREENTELRESIRQITYERRALQEKLSALVADRSSSKSMKVLQHRNEALKKEVERLSRKIKSIEGTITRVSI